MIANVECGMRNAEWPEQLSTRLSCVSPILALLFCILSLMSVSAQPVPKITSISPQFIQRGTTIDLTIAGTNLASVSGFIFSGDAGLSATNVPPPAAAKPAISIESSAGTISRAETPAPKDDKRLIVKLTAAADAKLGSREFRVVSSNGVSNPVNINIGHLPEVAEKAPNNSLEQAQEITFPAVVSGVINAAAQVDYYRFKATKGQDLIFDVDAFRTGSPLDSTLAMLDSAGKELVRSEDVDGFDSFIAFNVPADGDYVVSIRDFRFQGSAAHKYRISAGPLPYLESIFPFGGQRGKQVEVALTGKNLEGTTKMVFGIAPNSPLGRQDIRANTPKGYSNPFPFDVSDFPDAFETEPNDAADKANPVTTPVVINGKIGAAKDSDRFKFKAASDQKLVCEVVASRFGSSLDALLVLEDSKGAVLQQNDDVAAGDARIEFDAKKDTEYVLAIRDLTGRGGENFAYRLAVRPPSAAEASFVVRFSPDVVRVHRGGISKIRCDITRTGFDGPIRVAFQDLPAGVYGESVVFTAAPGSGLMLLSATASAQTGTFPLKLMATGTIGGKSVSRSAETILNDKLVKESFVTVLDSAPFTVDLITLSADVEQNRSSTIDVMVQRREGFMGDVKLTAEGFSAAAKDPITKSLTVTDVTLKPAESLGKVKVRATQDSEIGTRTIVIRGEATVDGQQVVQYSREVPVTITQIPFVVSSTLPKLSVTALPTNAQSAASEASTTIKVERRAGFTNELQLSADGIPAGILTTLDKIPANGTETILKIVATEKAAVTNYSFTVLATGVHKDRTYRHRTGPVALVVSAPEPMEQQAPPPILATNATKTVTATSAAAAVVK
jgi:hypothetical protein